MYQTLKILILPFFLAVSAGVAAQGLDRPEGEEILTITGKIAYTNAEGAAVFDLAMLDALEQRTTMTETPWFDGPQSFSGPTLAELLEHVGAQGANLRIIALNDYAADMPVQDTQDAPVILASRHNGDVMSVRDKGPLFVIYPFSEMPQLNNEVYFSRSVWQVKAIEVLP